MSDPKSTDPKSAAPKSAAPAPRRGGTAAAVAAAACLALAGGAAFYYATLKNTAATRDSDVDQRITISDTACSPMEVTLPGGKRSFEIVNASRRPVEWEIVDGVMVLAERENIAPGFHQRLSAQLAPGDYEMTCGLLSNPRGTLHITASDEADAAANEVSLRKFLGPLSEYRVYLVVQSGQALKSARALQAALAAGDLEAARSAWQAARLPYRRIEPLAFRISDLENRIDPRAAYLSGREEDPGFTGYHRIEYGLFAQNSTKGLAPVADQLVSDLGQLQSRLKEMQLSPELLLSLPGDMAQQIAQSQIPEGEDLYSGTDLPELAASVEGLAKLSGLLETVARPVAPEAANALRGDLEALQDQLAQLSGPQGYPRYDTLDPEQRDALAQGFQALASALEKLQPVIGMN